MTTRAAALLACAAEHVAHLGALRVLADADLHTEMVDAFDDLAEVLRRYPSQPERFALARAIRYEARRVAEDLLNDDDQPEAWGNARKALEAALDRDADAVAACDECAGTGRDCDCHGGLVTDDVTSMLLRLRDEAIAAIPPLVPVATVPSDEKAA